MVRTRFMRVMLVLKYFESNFKQKSSSYSDNVENLEMLNVKKSNILLN